MRYEGLENLTCAGHIEGQRDKGKQRITFLESFSKWMVARQFLRFTKKRKVRKTVNIFLLFKYSALFVILQRQSINLTRELLLVVSKSYSFC